MRSKTSKKKKKTPFTLQGFFTPLPCISHFKRKKSVLCEWPIRPALDPADLGPTFCIPPPVRLNRWTIPYALLHCMHTQKTKNVSKFQCAQWVPKTLAVTQHASKNGRGWTLLENTCAWKDFTIKSCQSNRAHSHKSNTDPVFFYSPLLSDSSYRDIIQNKTIWKQGAKGKHEEMVLAAYKRDLAELHSPQPSWTEICTCFSVD